VLATVEKIETYVRRNGGGLAFPVNIATDEEAAHWTPSSRTSRRFSTGALVKLDVGVEIGGYIGDNALTIEIAASRHDEMRDAAREALQRVIEMTAPGVNTSLLGSAVQETIESYGLRPVANLTGHGIKRYDLHCGISIPSVSGFRGTVLRKDDVIAVEPFATNGAGRVGGKRNSNIYHFVRPVRVRDSEAVELLERIRSEFHGLPFAERWLHAFNDDPQPSLQKLLRAGAVAYYPVLDELGHGMVTQAEHTLLLTSSGVEVLTQ
jgi:methionyl aminopeptidase